MSKWGTSDEKVSHLLDDSRLAAVQKQQGVLTVLAFHEGFPVKSAGNGDYEQVAAVAEDFLRAGRKMAREMKLGDITQIILESDERKCIIAPYGDLFLCLLTRPDVHLGLIRLIIRNLQDMD